MFNFVEVMRYIFLLIFSFSFAQQNSKVDFKTMNARLVPNTTDKSISGEVNYQFEVLKAIDTIAIDAIKMDFTNVKINGKTYCSGLKCNRNAKCL